MRIPYRGFAKTFDKHDSFRCLFQVYKLCGNYLLPAGEVRCCQDLSTFIVVPSIEFQRNMVHFLTVYTGLCEFKPQFALHGACLFSSLY